MTKTEKKLLMEIENLKQEKDCLFLEVGDLEEENKLLKNKLNIKNFKEEGNSQ